MTSPAKRSGRVVKNAKHTNNCEVLGVLNPRMSRDESVT